MKRTVRVITISREYGSGGGAIARVLAQRLGWRLVDNALIEEIAKIAGVTAGVAERLDESVDPWFHRLTKELWRGGFEGSATRLLTNVFDADAMAALCRRVVTEAADIGQCVIVGRGGQCILQNHPDAFHVSVYATLADRIRRVRERNPTAMDPTALIAETDRRRASYIRRYFGHDWTNRHLYDLQICSSCGIEQAASIVLFAACLMP